MAAIIPHRPAPRYLTRAERARFLLEIRISRLPAYHSSMNSQYTTPRLVAVAATLLLVISCEKSEVRSYSVKKPQAPTENSPVAESETSGAMRAESAAPTAEAPRWPIPEGWSLLPGPKPMRLATFMAGSGDNALEVVLSEFPGDAGGLLPNINRWRAQLSLPSATLDEVRAESTSIDVLGVSGHMVHLRGEASHMLGAVLYNSGANGTRFLKTTGSPTAIEVHKPAFEQFARALAAQEKGQ